MKRNAYLRIKLKSLAAEARIIRREEKRANEYRDFDLQNSLTLHRKGTVRSEARATLLAYQYLRGIPYAACEKPNPKKHNPIDMDAVKRMVKKYGGSTAKSLTDWFEGKELVQEAA